jgi:hypothetical protein
MGSAINNRLHKHLLVAKLYDGETPHSFRVGLSNTLSSPIYLIVHFCRPHFPRSGSLAKFLLFSSLVRDVIPVIIDQLPYSLLSVRSYRRLSTLKFIVNYRTRIS